MIRVAASLLLVALSGGRLAAQDGARGPDRWELRASLALGGTLIEDGNGTTVSAGAAPSAGVAALWRTGRALAGLSVHGGAGGLEARDGARSWNAGTLARADLFAVIGAERSRWGIRFGAGAVFLRGPEDLVPFRGDDGFRLHWGAEGLVDAGLDRRGRIRAHVGADAMRFAPAGTAVPAEAGAVLRLRLGLAYAL